MSRALGGAVDADHAGRGARVVRVDPLTDSRWDDLVGELPGGGLFHSSAWLAMLERSFGYRPAHLAYEREGRLQGLLPLLLVSSPITGKRLVSLPFSGPAGPIGQSARAINQLVEAALEARSELGCSHLNIRTAAPLAGADRLGFAATQPFVWSVLTLGSDVVTTWAGLRMRGVRWQINRARRKGVTTRFSDDPADLTAFYRLFIETCRKHGVPPQSFSMFHNMRLILEPRGMFKLILAELDGRLINAAVCAPFRDTLFVVYIGTDYRYMKYYAVKLSYWALIEWACRAGYRRVDFLQTHVNNHGLRWFKRSLGAIEQPVFYYYYPGTDGVFQIREALIGGESAPSRAVRAVVRRLPAAVLVRLGGALFRHVG